MTFRKEGSYLPNIVITLILRQVKKWKVFAFIERFS